MQGGDFMANMIFNVFKKKIMDGSYDLDSNSFKVMLVYQAYTPNQDTHTTIANVTNEVSATGYTAGGKALSGLSVSQDNTNNKGVWDGADVIWASSSISAYGAVIYDTTAASGLVCYFDFGAYKVSATGTFTIAWNAAGIVSLA